MNPVFLISIINSMTALYINRSFKSHKMAIICRTFPTKLTSNLVKMNVRFLVIAVVQTYNINHTTGSEVPIKIGTSDHL